MYKLVLRLTTLFAKRTKKYVVQTLFVSCLLSKKVKLFNPVAFLLFFFVCFKFLFSGGSATHIHVSSIDSFDEQSHRNRSLWAQDVFLMSMIPCKLHIAATDTREISPHSGSSYTSLNRSINLNSMGMLDAYLIPWNDGVLHRSY